MVWPVDGDADQFVSLRVLPAFQDFAPDYSRLWIFAFGVKKEIRAKDGYLVNESMAPTLRVVEFTLHPSREVLIIHAAHDLNRKILHG
jgi:hypothetical protein